MLPYSSIKFEIFLINNLIFFSTVSIQTYTIYIISIPLTGK